jgi:hypothetical protein
MFNPTLLKTNFIRRRNKLLQVAKEIVSPLFRLHSARDEGVSRVNEDQGEGMIGTSQYVVSSDLN